MAAAASEAAAAGLQRVGESRDILGECPTWDARAGVLWWIDIRQPRIRQLDPATGTVQTWDMPAIIGALALTEGPELIVALGNRVMLWHPETGEARILAEAPDLPGHRFNDGRTDRQGRFWVGTMHNVTRAPEGTLFRLDPDGLAPVLNGISIPNSLAWAPDGRRMYFADSLKHRIDAFDFDPAAGALGVSRPFASSTPPAFPDGSTVDAQGHLWVAEFNGGRVTRIAPDGTISAIVETPVDRPTACALGGADLRTLYITTTCQNMTDAERAAQPMSGALFSVRVPVPGLPEPRVTHLPARRTNPMTDTPAIARIDAFAFRVPIAQPIKVAFGTFLDRPMVLVRVTDSEGAQGWGEIWSNWPAVGAEHRARLAVDLGAALIGQSYDDPAQAFDHLTRLTEVLVLQTGEVGPITQVIAGIDIALWDLKARRAGLPLARLLTNNPMERVPVYATGINPDGAADFAAARYAEGHRAFKLKIGFGWDRDLGNIADVRAAIGAAAEFSIDANQSLSPDEAASVAQAAAIHNLRWFEEPVRVDTPLDDWDSLASASPVALAGGENLRGDEFAIWLARGALRYYQPDITKWGGITGCMRVAKAAAQDGAVYCPHVFGGGIASLASLHALAAAGGEGNLEMDCHPNAGRELIIGDLLPVTEGFVPLTTGPGLGAEIDLPALNCYATWSSDQP